MSTPSRAPAAAEPKASIYEALGGEQSLRELVDRFYRSIFDDPLLQPAFGQPVATHVDHLTAFLAEVFDGPTRYSDEFGGFARIVAVHRGRTIREPQRRRFVQLFMDAYDNQHFADPRLRDAVESCIIYGSQIATVNSNAATDADLHPQQTMPHWHWQTLNG
jgi:hemoglobin